MKHAGAAALHELTPLLEALRALPQLQERSRGVFYRKGRAFLHFHEDRAGLFADVRGANDPDFLRVDVTQEAGRTELLGLVAERLR